MRIIIIAVLIFCINLSAMLVYQANLFPGYGVSGTPGVVDETMGLVSKDYGHLVVDNDPTRQILESDLLNGLSWFDRIKMIFMPNYTLEVVFGIPGPNQTPVGDLPISWLLSAPIYLLYIVAIVQFLRNFAGEGAI